MKTLEHIKNETATKHGYLSLVKLITSGHTTNTLKVIDEMLILVQKECLKNASDNLRQCSGSFNSDYFSQKQSITNENNIIK